VKQPSKALWRIEFRTDLTRASAPVLPLGYLLDAHWDADDQVRWLGLLFRRRLNPLEIDLVNTATWPELQKLEPFMKVIFEKAWAETGDNGELGSAKLAFSYPHTSALQFVGEEQAILGLSEDPIESFPHLYLTLLNLRSRLTPTIKAPVVPIEHKKRKEKVRPIARPDVELMNQAA
jgi:hypothetical protein